MEFPSLPVKIVAKKVHLGREPLNAPFFTGSPYASLGKYNVGSVNYPDG